MPMFLAKNVGSPLPAGAQPSVSSVTNPPQSNGSGTPIDEPKAPKTETGFGKVFTHPGAPLAIGLVVLAYFVWGRK